MNVRLNRLASCPAPLRLGIFLLALLSIWVPLAVPLYWLKRDAIAIVLLYGEFIFLLQLWGRKVYRQPQLLKSYGLERTRRNGLDLLQGLGIGLVSLWSLFALETGLGWISWQTSPVFLPQIILEGFGVGLGIGFAEELLFRGWLFDEFQRDYSFNVSLWIDAFLFALLHFVKPLAEIWRTWVQFPSLVLLGLTLVWAKRSTQGRLGLSIGLHAGLVWGYYMINVGQLVTYSQQIPSWVIGIDRNPLASAMGVLFLSAIALWMYQQAKRASSRKTHHN